MAVLVAVAAPARAQQATQAGNGAARSMTGTTEALGGSAAVDDATRGVTRPFYVYAVLANTLLGLAGFSLCCLTAHLLVERIGVAAGLALALVVSIACNLLFWMIRRRPTAVRKPSRA